uniref:Hemerythrin n=1 Tax=Phascolosoma agassizii TaxID=360543 RepID=A0A1S6QD37_9ANNE|nr:hemerythrin [Phascolosoma agassizii]
MGFDIPEPFVWDASFKVFYENLDDEHRNIFKALFDVSADQKSASALAALIDVTANHFSHEEGMMQKANYAGYPPHKKMHEDFLTKIRGLKAPLDDGTVHYAKDWLVNHIKTTDFKYKEKL